MSSLNETPAPPRFRSEGEWLEWTERVYAPRSKVEVRRSLTEGEWLEQMEQFYAASNPVVTIPQAMPEGEWLEWIESIYQED